MKKTVVRTRKLELRKDTLRTLKAADLTQVAGGGLLGQIYYWLTGSCGCGGDDGGNSVGGVRA